MNSTTTQTEKSETKPLKLRANTSPRTVTAVKPVFTNKLEERKYLKERLAAAFRIFSKLGYDEGVAGHISCRDVIRSDCFWVNPYGVAFDLMCVSDLLLINHDGEIIEGGRPGDGQIYNAAGFAIHGAIHQARKDIHAAAHSHSIYGKAFSTLGRNIDIATHEGASFSDTVRLYDNFGGVVLDDEEGRRICKALGPNGKGIILQNHGILSAATTVDAAVAFFIRLEQLCEIQLMSDSVGVVGGLNGGDAERVFAEYGGEEEAFHQAQEYFDWIDELTGGDYKL